MMIPVFCRIVTKSRQKEEKARIKAAKSRNEYWKLWSMETVYAF